MNKLKVVFMGTPEFSVNVLKMLIEETEVIGVVTKPDAPVGRKKVLTESPVAVIAREHNIKTFKPVKLRNEYEEILNLHPDVIITCAYGQIVPKQVLDYPQYGCINVHASLLPKYRGASPITEAIINGDTETGITIMYMEESLDTGNIIHAKAIPIEDTDTLGTLSDKLSLLGADLLKSVLPKIQNGENFDIPQRDEDATYVTKLTREDETLDFTKTCKQVYDYIRALNPHPLANILIDGEEWKIIESRKTTRLAKEVGVISSVGKDYFAISCSDYELEITKIKPAGKKEMFVRDFFNGYAKDKLLNKKVGE
jgi:methionyl-tRNA formyltransferase